MKGKTGDHNHDGIERWIWSQKDPWKRTSDKWAKVARDQTKGHPHHPSPPRQVSNGNHNRHH